MPASRYYQAEGGSSTQGAFVSGPYPGGPYPSLYAVEAAVATDVVNRAGGGAGGALEAFISRQPSEIASFYAAPAINMVSVLFSNGLEPANLAITDGGDVNAYAVRAAAYLDTFTAERCFVVVITTLPRSDAGFNVVRNALNAIMRTWVGVHCHAVVDVAADPDIGPDAAGDDTSKYSDGTHYTQSTHDKIETYLKPVLDGLQRPGWFRRA